ncbi:MAG: DUF1552 domain-containing protein [Polyangiaceae bacterium]|nr:DUF1552 domain-containing protein [Polyangiaceae bacterium]
MNKPLLSRRSLLVGAGGAVVGLPWLEAMVGRGVHAQAAVIPKRFFLAFGGVTCGLPRFSQPDTTGPNYDLKRTLMPLTAVKDEVTLVSGLRLPANGPGSWGGGGTFHNSTNSPILCGLSNPDNGNATMEDVTSDQVVADAIAGDTRFRSLEYRVQLRNYRESARAGTISARRSQGGSLQLNPPQASPQLAYDALFTGFTPPGGGSTPAADPAAAAKLLRDRSVLDRVSVRAQALIGRLGADDRKRMERHYEEIRALEMRLGSVFQGSALSCAALPRPPADPATSEAYYGDRIVGYSDERARGPIFSSLMHMAFTCDLTRVGTNLITYAQCCMNSQPLLNLDEVADLHELSHGAGTPENTADCAAWHVQQFADLVTLLKNTPEGGGTVLDNCAMVLLFEAGSEDDGNVGNPHTGENMWALVAGGAGGLKRGHHIAAANQPHPCNVLISLMQAVGLQTNTHGEISGRVAEMFV